MQNGTEDRGPFHVRPATSAKLACHDSLTNSQPAPLACVPRGTSAPPDRDARFSPHRADPAPGSLCLCRANAGEAGHAGHEDTRDMQGRTSCYPNSLAPGRPRHRRAPQSPEWNDSTLISKGFEHIVRETKLGGTSCARRSWAYANPGIRRAEVRLSMHCSQSAARRSACSAAHGGRGRGALVGAAPSRPARIRSRLARPSAT